MLLLPQPEFQKVCPLYFLSLLHRVVIQPSSGHAEQWGSVHRKKDKKPAPQSHSKDHTSNRDRGDFRGGRGGRGGRAGPGRGGAARGAFSRGGHHDTNGRHAKASPSQPADSVTPKGSDDTPAADSVAHSDLPSKPVDDQVQDPIPVSDPSTSATPTTWAGENSLNGSTSHSAPTQAPLPVKPLSKTPTAVKLSWAQIARQVAS